MAIKWKVDPMHSEMQFQVRHLMISKVTGNFNSFDLEVETETEDFNTAKAIVLTADIESINTNNEQRDAHLKSADFFSAEQYPTLDFEGTLKLVKGNEYTLTGPLTLRGTTKNIDLGVEFGGIMVDPWGNTKAGFEINGKFNRKDFGLGWNALTEAGGMVVSEEVKLHINVELAKA